MRNSLIALVMMLILVAGCQATSRVEIPIPGDGVKIITGQAAVDYIENLKPTSAKLNEVVPTLTFILIGGLAFWGFTRSRYGWVIPASVIGGMVFIIAFTKWAGWIVGGVILVTLIILIWKAVEYKRERDLKHESV